MEKKHNINSHFLFASVFFLFFPILVSALAGVFILIGLAVEKAFLVSLLLFLITFLFEFLLITFDELRYKYF